MEAKDFYTNPANVDSIIEELKATETHDGVVKLIDRTFQGWILGWPRRYCVDYPHFQNNWRYVCEKAGTKPLHVVVVDFLDFDKPEYSLLRMFAELLTVFGHSVRRKEEFLGCPHCGDAIPNKVLYDELVKRGVTTPAVWSTKCSTC